MGYTMTFYDRAPLPRAYSLLIDGGGTAITGGASQFETVEDADADMFMPVRCQSGTFRFITEEDDADARSKWEGMIPLDALSKPVKLMQGSTVVWQGYILPQVFQNDYPYIGTQEHEMPVQCPLSVLDSLDIDPDPNGSAPIVNSHPTITFAELLQTYIFGRLTGTTFQYYYVQGTTAVVAARLAVKVMWQNFLETDSNGRLTCKYTCKQVLEEFCKFFGYTCRVCGQDVYFTQPTGNSLGFARYTTLTGTGTAIQRGTFTITDAMFADTEDNEAIHPGVGKATVRSDINELDNLIEIPYDELYDRYNAGLPAGTQQDPRIIIRSVDWYSHNVYNLIRQPDTDGGHLIYDNDNVSIDVYMQTKPGVGDDAGNQKRYGRFFVYDDTDVGDDITTQQIPESKGQFSWRKCIEVFHSHVSGTPSSSTPSFKITSKQVFVISDGMLYINFKCHEVSAWLVGNENVETYPKAMCSLKIGSNTYWNGSAWVQSNSLVTFDLSFTSDGAKTNRPSYRQAYGGDIVNVPQYDGYGAKVDGTMRGNIEFSVIDVSSFATIDWEGSQVAYINGFLPLLDFEIGFVRGVIEDTQHRGNEYSVKGGAFRDEVNVDLIWASDVPYGPSGYQRRMPAGLGYILDGNDKPKQNVLSMNGSSVVAEEMVAGLIATYGQSTHRVVQMNLRSFLLGTVTPQAVSYGLESGMFPLAISHNWREDITTLTLIAL